MKALLIKANLSTILITSALVFPSEAISENTNMQGSPLSHRITVENKHPLAMGSDMLNQAYTNYSAGNIDLASKNLADAKKWLQAHNFSRDEKTRSEVAKLVDEIYQLQEKINHPSKQDEGAIARLWHRSTSLVGREIDHLKKSWQKTSAANRTYKLLLDARLHFNYAEHELFVSHDKDKANTEISKVLTYLDEAAKIAIPKIHEQIASIKTDIIKLSNNQVSVLEEQMIINALNEADSSLEKASHSSSPEIQSRTKNLMSEIKNLKNDVVLLEKRHQYDVVMERLHSLDAQLSD